MCDTSHELSQCSMGDTSPRAASREARRPSMTSFMSFEGDLSRSHVVFFVLTEGDSFGVLGDFVDAFIFSLHVFHHIPYHF